MPQPMRPSQSQTQAPTTNKPELYSIVLKGRVFLENIPISNDKMERITQLLVMSTDKCGFIKINDDIIINADEILYIKKKQTYTSTYNTRTRSTRPSSYDEDSDEDDDAEEDEEETKAPITPPPGKPAGRPVGRPKKVPTWSDPRWSGLSGGGKPKKV